MVPYVDVVLAVMVMCVLLHVCMLRDCEGDGNAGVVMVMWAVHVVQVMCLAHLAC